MFILIYDKLRKHILPLSCMLVLPVLGILYPLLDSGNRGVHLLMTDLDYAIPLIKPFIIPYILWDPFIIGLLILLCIKDTKVYYKTLMTLAIGELISYFIFFVYQTYVPRPVLNGHDMLTGMVQFIYNHDNPYNAFPSIHVLTTYAVMKGLLSSNVRAWAVKVPCLLFGVLIILSTLFVKQHTLLDVAGGLIVTETVYAVLGRLWKSDVLFDAPGSGYTKSRGI